MPKNTESLNRSLFELIHSKGLDPTMLSTAGKEIPTPEEAEVFQFNFVKDGEDYGTVTISIDGLHKLTVYFSDDIANSEKEESESGDVSWYQLLNQLKKFSQKYQLSFELRNVSNLKHDMAKREYMKKKESIAEGYYPMGRKASYSDAVPSVKIVLQHTRQIEEGEQRYRNIARIFLENEHGERFLAPTTKPGIARVYARHIAEGGMPHDEKWNHIGSLCEEYQKMAGFVRATRNGQFNESTQKLIAEGINHYQALRESLGKLAGHRGYNAYFESWTPPLMEDDSDTSNINELFVQETVDPRIESVMPILSKLHKKISEMSEVNELSEWADKLIEGDEDIEDNEADDAVDNAEQDLTEAPGAETLAHNEKTEAGNLKAFGLAEDTDNPVAGAITRRILMQRPDLLEKYGPVAVTQAIDDVADFVGDTDEIGSSDVSGWIKQVERSLGGVDEGIVDTVKKVGSKVFDKLGGGSEEDLLKDLQKKAGIPASAQHGKPNMAKPKEEEVDESALQAYLGDKKYGKDGMDALRKAGQEDASEKTMQNIRAKFSKKEEPVAEAAGQLSIQQLATISDEALDNAYHYGRSTPGNSFGWQANLKSAAYAKQMIDKGVTDIEAISDAIHKGWNVTAQAFVKNPDQFGDTEKLKAAGKLEAKLQQRAELMKKNYAQLPEEEKEKDRVVARALLQALKGQQGVAEDWSAPPEDTGGHGEHIRQSTGGNYNSYWLSQLMKDPSLESYIQIDSGSIHNPSKELIQGIKSKKWEGFDTGKPGYDKTGGWYITAKNPMYFKEFVKALSQSVTKDRQIHVKIDPFVKNARAKNAEIAEDEFAGNYATGEAGQWRNKGPKANKPATIGDLVGEGQEDLDAIKRMLGR